MKLTKYKLDLMKHTISDKERNWFGTNLGGKDSKEFDELVSVGYASKHPAPPWSGDEVIYRLTNEGKKAIDNEG